MKQTSFIINDESLVNSHGFRLLNRGAKLERYNKNPVLFYDHDSRRLIGRGENLRTEGAQLLFDPVFDAENPDALTIQGLVDRDFLRGCSPGIRILNTQYNDAGELEVTEWELCEISLTPIPSNASAVKESSHMQDLYIENIVTLSINPNPKNNDKMTPTKKENQTPKTPLTLRESLQASIKEFESLKDQLDKQQSLSALDQPLKDNVSTSLETLHAIRAQLDKQTNETTRSLADRAISLGVIAQDERKTFEQLAQTAPDIVERMIQEKSTEETSLSAMIKTAQAKGGEKAGWDFLQWAKNDPKGLQALKENDPDTFERLRQDYQSTNQ